MSVCECIQLNDCNCIGQVDSFCRLAVGDCSDVVVDVDVSQLKPDDELAPASCDSTFALRLSAGHFQLPLPLVPTCAWPERLGSFATGN